MEIVPHAENTINYQTEIVPQLETIQSVESLIRTVNVRFVIISISITWTITKYVKERTKIVDSSILKREPVQNVKKDIL